MNAVTKKWCWLALGASSSVIVLACAGRAANGGSTNDAGTTGIAGMASSAAGADTTDSAGIAGSSATAGSPGSAGAVNESPCAPNDFAADACNSCSCSDAKTWKCASLDCALSGCPAARPASAANCAATATFAKDPRTGTCCPYNSACAAPDGWARFASGPQCMGIGSGGCPAGFSDCNQSKQDGCETRTPAGTTCANVCAAELAMDGDSASSLACPSEPCPTGMVCIVEVGGVAGGGGARCEPIPSNCDGQPSCACMKYCSCVHGFGSRPESCSEEAGVIYCDNGIR